MNKDLEEYYYKTKDYISMLFTDDNTFDYFNEEPIDYER